MYMKQQNPIDVVVFTRKRKQYIDNHHNLFISAQNYATAAPAPEKIEVFVNDKSLLVDPGITVLQVKIVFSFLLLSC